MQAPLFIVWRESLEALLIIGILYNWLKLRKLESYLPLIWRGLGLGLLMAFSLAVVFWFAGQWLSSTEGEWFFIIMIAFAAMLILQMISFMHKNGRNLKKQLEAQAAISLQRSERWGLLILTMLAVAREGSETVVFLAGVGAQQQETSLALFIFGAVCGLFLALFTFWFLQKFTTIFSWKWFFIISEYGLLLIGGGLFMTACDKFISQLMNYDLPEAAYDFLDNPLWDSSWLLQDSSTLTGLTGYHAMPSLMEVLALAFYWGLALWLMYRPKKLTKVQLKFS